MNRVYQFICLLLTITCFIGCDSTGQKPTLDYLPVKLDKEDRWGMVGPSGKMLFNDEFEKEPSPVVNGVFYVEENNGYSLFLAKEKPVLIPGAEGFKSVGYCNEGLIPVVREGERIMLIDTDGKSKFTLDPVDGEEIIACGRLFLDGNLIIQIASGKWGAVNHKGNVTIKPIYDELDYAGQNIFIGYIYDNSSEDMSKVLFGLDRSGNVLFKLKGSYTPSHNLYYFGFAGGRLAVTKGDAVGYINLKGEYTKLPSKFKVYVPFTDKYYGFMNEDDNCGIVNGENDIILRAKYKNIAYLGNNLFYVVNGDSNQIVNSDGDIKAEIDEKSELVSLTYIDNLFKNSFGLIGGAEHSLMFYGTDGKPLSKTDFYEISLKVLDIKYDMYMRSDYSDYIGVMNKIADCIDSGGYKDVRLGYTLNGFIDKEENPSDYIGRNFIVKEENDLGHLKSNIILRIYGDGEIAKEEPVYEYYPGYYNVETDIVGYEDNWNNQVTIKEISISMTGSKTKFKEAKDTLISKLTKKGFEVTVDGGESYAAVLTKEDTNVLFQLINDQFLVTILPTKYNRQFSYPFN